MADEKRADTVGEWKPPIDFTPEQLATPPSCPPLVGGFGPETPEVREEREAAGGQAPDPLRVNKYEGESERRDADRRRQEQQRQEQQRQDEQQAHARHQREADTKAAARK